MLRHFSRRASGFEFDRQAAVPHEVWVNPTTRLGAVRIRVVISRLQKWKKSSPAPANSKYRFPAIVGPTAHPRELY
jgi:hypothetical protein